MLKVPYGQDAYSVIGKYIRDHITAIEDIIAVIKIDNITTNQLFMVDMNEENYFIWNNDWYEGEKDVALIDFFPVSEAINPSAQPERPFEIQDILDYLDTVLHPIISLEHWNVYSELHDMISTLPPAQPQRKTDEWCHDCKEYDSEKHCCPRFNRVIRQTLSEQPGIIRCKDCKHRDPEDKKCDCGHDILWQLPRDDNWFCADAERREDADNNQI